MRASLTVFHAHCTWHKSPGQAHDILHFYVCRHHKSLDGIRPVCAACATDLRPLAGDAGSPENLHAQGVQLCDRVVRWRSGRPFGIGFLHCTAWSLVRIKPP
jgi:hypothetical protein